MSAPRPTAWRRRAVWRSGGLPRATPARPWPDAGGALGARGALVWVRHPRRRTTRTAPARACETPVCPSQRTFRRTARGRAGRGGRRRAANQGGGEDRRRAHGGHRPAPAGRRWRHPSVVLGRYRLVRQLGSGGFGVVWLADDEHLERAVAVKRIAMHDAAVAGRAEREARAAARLAHPGIVALYESGRDEEAVYLVSELVRGRTLADLMRRGRAVRPRRAARSASRCATPWPTRTAAGSSIATSSPATSSCPIGQARWRRRGQAHRLRHRAHGRRRRADR